MKKPKLYNSEILLQTFIKRSTTNDLVRYINQLNHYIEWLEKHTDLDDDDEEGEYRDSINTFPPEDIE